MNKLLAPLVHPLIILDAAFSSEKKNAIDARSYLKKDSTKWDNAC